MLYPDWGISVQQGYAKQHPKPVRLKEKNREGCSNTNSKSSVAPLLRWYPWSLTVCAA
jgi:hypothetical protein